MYDPYTVRKTLIRVFSERLSSETDKVPVEGSSGKGKLGIGSLEVIHEDGEWLNKEY